ncbi:hypothetical protein [[Kitasatospora] papulosa]|uniref:hypothetical protein n=1 Tax=[Kitasatospora] papulosa TaxID=1464011 RepID=UPI0036AAA3D2
MTGRAPCQPPRFARDPALHRDEREADMRFLYLLAMAWPVVLVAYLLGARYGR